MGKFLAGVILGVVAGAVVSGAVVLLREAPGPASTAPAPDAAEPAGDSQDLRDLQADLDEARARNIEQAAELERARGEVTAARAEAAEAAARFEELAAVPPPALEPPADPEAGSPEPTFGHEDRIRVGKPLPEGLAAKLGLKDQEAAAIETALSDEDRRIREALFYEFSADLPSVSLPDLEKLGTEGVLMRLMPKVMPEIQRLAQEQADGVERSPAEAFGESSYLGRIRSTFLPERAETHAQLEQRVRPETLERLRSGPLSTSLFAAGNSWVMDMGFDEEEGEDAEEDSDPSGR